jgi:cell division protein FtsQ
MYRVMQPLLETLDFNIEKIELTARGSWRVWTTSGAQIELGRGTESELVERTQLLLKTLPQVSARYKRTPMALLGADMRHKDGYALRLRGVSTLDDNDKKIRMGQNSEIQRKRWLTWQKNTKIWSLAWTSAPPR